MMNSNNYILGSVSPSPIALHATKTPFYQHEIWYPSSEVTQTGLSKGEKSSRLAKIRSV